MRNKQKAWRTEARKIKLALIATGQHIRGARYGRAVARMRSKMTLQRTSVMSPLMSRLLVRYESLQP